MNATKATKFAGLITLLVLGALAVLMVASREVPLDPVYRGRRLSRWLDDWWLAPSVLSSGNAAALSAARQKHIDAESAVRALGTNALPYLLHKVRQRDSAFKAALLRNKQVCRIAEKAGLLQYLEPVERGNIMAAQALSVVGPGAEIALDDLIDVLEHNPSSEVRSYVATCLGKIGPSAANAVPALTRAAILGSGSGSEHQSARAALVAIGGARTNGFPIVMNYLHSTNETVQIAALVALDVVDPEGVNSNHGLRHRAQLPTGVAPPR